MNPSNSEYTVAASESLGKGDGSGDRGGVRKTDGAVYGKSGVRLEQAKLTASDGEATNRFGRSVAINGDTIAIGAY